jgi:hypothetical protein
MEDDFFPDFLEFEETESNDKVSSPKKEKKASSNSTKKEKALNTKDDDFELFSNEESIVEAEVVETTSAIDSAIEEESTIESAQTSPTAEEVEEETIVDNSNIDSSNVEIPISSISYFIITSFKDLQPVNVNERKLLTSFGTTSFVKSLPFKYKFPE